ncbi:MAG: PAS domain S-box protein, partial [Acidobacteriota bacterium]
MPDRFLDLVTSARDVFAIVDQSGSITYVSPAIQATLGLILTEVQGSILWELVHPKDVVDVHAALQDVIGHGERRRLEFEMLDVNGRWHCLDTSIVPIEGANPPAVGLISTDITERRQLEARLREREEQL